MMDGRYQVPTSWLIEPIKYVSTIVQGSTPDSSNADYWSNGADSLVWVTPADMHEIGEIEDSARHISKSGYNSCGTQMVPVGSVVISTRAPIGKINRAAIPLCTNQGCKSLVTDSMDSRYLYWAVINSRGDLVSNGRGTTFMELSAYSLGHVFVPVPPIGEQRVIAMFLDKECHAINEAMRALEKQLSTLERYRASVIHEAVTRGLDLSVPTKPSGVEWIGEIPEGWEAKSFKYCAHVAANLVDPDKYPELIEIDPDNIESGSGRLVDVVTAGEVGAISAKQLFSKGQIIYSKIRPALNKVAIAPADGLCSADMYPIATDQNKRWLLYVMRSDMFVRQTTLISSRVAMPKINVDQLGAIKIPVPPIEQQELIADYLDARTSAIDTILDTKRKQLDILKRRRQSLIYEYVTGKRRVGEGD